FAIDGRAAEDTQFSKHLGGPGDLLALLALGIDSAEDQQDAGNQRNGDHAEHQQNLPARCDLVHRGCRHVQCALSQLDPKPISTPSGTSSSTPGCAASAITLSMTGEAASTSLSGSSNTSSSCTWSSIRTWPRSASASAGPMRTMARLMISALVPWIGALIAARSLPCRSRSEEHTS